MAASTVLARGRVGRPEHHARGDHGSHGCGRSPGDRDGTPGPAAMLGVGDIGVVGDGGRLRGIDGLDGQDLLEQGLSGRCMGRDHLVRQVLRPVAPEGVDHVMLGHRSPPSRGSVSPRI